MQFPEDFAWGTATSAYQIEGACDADGKGPSVWDTFTQLKGKIKDRSSGQTACNFYHHWSADLDILALLGIPNFRFSISWPRVIPQGTGAVNKAGLDFYDRLVDECLKRNITPWLTLYHWDLPQALENRGGWTNRNVVDWYLAYADVVTKRLGDRVNHWMVLNEPLAYTGCGYFLGIHAPGKRWLKNFLPAVHHTSLVIGEGTRLIKANCPNAKVGSTFSGSWVEPHRPQNKADLAAAKRADALLNRLFLEPALGLGYPLHDLPFIQKIEKWIQPGDEAKQMAPLDFVGLQLYTREVIRRHFLMPYIWARLVSARERKVPFTDMGWEIYPEALKNQLLRFKANYHQMPPIVVTENGAALPDPPPDANGRIADTQRIAFLEGYIHQLKLAMDAGVDVRGYFVWSLLDNFEWAEGYRPRFGLVNVDYETQKRTIKDSGYWYGDFVNRNSQ